MDSNPNSSRDVSSPPTAFPAGFVWGAATSAYQVEGSPLADGAGPSNWHRFSHTPGRTHAGETGDVACDHYRRFPEDIEWMARLGLGAYRFSVSWSRILPAGRGAANAAGVAFYDRLVDALLARGIEPLVTLYHWDLPAWLDDLGGWLNPDIAHWFADYAETMFRALGDRVPRWATLNEPWVVVDAGYVHGVHAPGHRSLYEAAVASHNLMRAHGAAVARYRGVGRREIGLVVNLEPKDPATPGADDRAATGESDAYMNRQYLDPALLGRPAEGLAEILGDAWIEFPAGDYEAIRQPIDFLGINYYTRSVMCRDAAGWPVRARPVRQSGRPYTETGWEVHPEGLTRTLCWVRERYGDIPLYVTENGAAFADPAHATVARIEDPDRVAYYRDHLLAVLEAMRRGVDLRGYFAWSLLDNFEWSQGYTKRFGLLHVDFDTLARTPKASAEYYSEVIRTNGASLAVPLRV